MMKPESGGLAGPAVKGRILPFSKALNKPLNAMPHAKARNTRSFSV
jgi:hypothetical protein